MTATRVSEHRLGRQSFVLSLWQVFRGPLYIENFLPLTIYQSIQFTISISIDPLFQQSPRHFPVSPLNVLLTTPHEHPYKYIGIYILLSETYKQSYG